MVLCGQGQVLWTFQKWLCVLTLLFIRIWEEKKRNQSPGRLNTFLVFLRLHKGQGATRRALGTRQVLSPQWDGTLDSLVTAVID